MTKNQPWWKSTVVYQIYPRSFQDSNGDGIGDLQGIISRLDYLKRLGIGAIWLCPVYKSPNTDNGYDISDYEDIMDEFGTMADMDELIHEAKKRNIRIIMDLVVNHTSDKHTWFIESRKSKNNPYRDYYVWADPVNGHAPNDLKSTFSGSAWQYDKTTNQYYLHLFAPQQPDLNWKNPKMRHDIYKMMNFWINKGIGGFRMDVIDLIGKEPLKSVTSNGPKLHEYLHEMNRNTFGDTDLMTVGETWGATPENAQLYTDPKRQELSMVFQFEHSGIDQQKGKEKWDLAPFSVKRLKDILSKWQTDLADTGWNSLFWNNHDLPRIVSRWGNDKEYRVPSAKTFAILLHLMKGTPYIYQGEEIGMTNYPVKDISEVDDIESINMYKERLAKGYDKKDILHSINVKGRDNARIPMQWDATKNAGFTTGQPWLHINPNYQTVNVENALNEKNSVFYTYQNLIKLRTNNDLVVNGKYKLISDTADDVFAYIRSNSDSELMVVANVSSKENIFNSPLNSKRLIISSYSDSAESISEGETIHLRPWETVAYLIKGELA